MSISDTGGPAFPALEEHGLNGGMPGMTLRDYFAAKCMQGLMADPNTTLDEDGIAAASYRIADGMLRARNK